MQTKKKLYTYCDVLLVGGLAFVALCSLLALLPGVFWRILLPLLSMATVFLCFSNAVLIRREGLYLGNLFATAVGVFYTASGGILALLHPLLDRLHSALPLCLELLYCYAVSLLVGICIVGYLAAKRTAAFDKDFLIVLGCSISKEGGLRPLLKERTNRAIHFAWDQEIATGKQARYVPSGGQGADEIISEGSAMELYIVAHGAEFYEVFPEKQSRNTYENLLFSKKIIDELKPNAKVAFVTTNYHVLRSGFLAKRVGLSAEGVASRTKWYFCVNGFVREMIAIFAMYWWTHPIAAAVAVVLSIIIV